MSVFKKNNAYTKSPNNPAPSVVSKLKWLVPNIQVPKSMSRDRPLEKLVSWSCHAMRMGKGVWSRENA